MDAILFVFALAALMWCAVFFVRGSTLLGALAVLLAGKCFGKYFWSLNLGPLPLSVDLILLGIVVAAYFVQRGLGQLEPKKLGHAEWALIALLAVLTASTLTHDFRPTRPEQMPGETWNSLQFSPIYRLIVGYFLPVSLYWIARHSVLSKQHVQRFMGGLIAFSLYLAYIGFCEICKLWPLVFPRYIINPEIGLHFGRARGPMLHSVSFGLFVSAGLMALMAIKDSSGKSRWRWIAVMAPVLLAALYFSYTRSVWLGGALGLLLCLVLLLPRPWKKLLPMGALAAGLLVLAVKKDDILSFKREYSAQLTKESADARWIFLHVSWQMFLDHPVLGVGFGHFPEAKLPYLNDRSIDLPLQTIRGWVHHNALLCLLTETGIVGLGLFLTVLALWSHNAWLLWRHESLPPWVRGAGLTLLGTMPMYVVQLVFHDLSFMPLDQALVFVMAAVVSGLRANYLPVPARGFVNIPVFIRTRLQVMQEA